MRWHTGSAKHSERNSNDDLNKSNELLNQEARYFIFESVKQSLSLQKKLFSLNWKEHSSYYWRIAKQKFE